MKFSIYNLLAIIILLGSCNKETKKTNAGNGIPIVIGNNIIQGKVNGVLSKITGITAHYNENTCYFNAYGVNETAGLVWRVNSLICLQTGESYAIEYFPIEIIFTIDGNGHTKKSGIVKVIKNDPENRTIEMTFSGEFEVHTSDGSTPPPVKVTEGFLRVHYSI